MDWVSVLLWSATLLVTVGTLLPGLKISHWLVRGFDFPRLQFASLACFLLIIELALGPASSPSAWARCALLLGSLSVQLWWILPYTPIFPVQVPQSKAGDDVQEISLITANVLMTNRNYGALLSILKDAKADVVVTLETDTRWEQALSELEAEAWGYVHTVKVPKDNLYGMHVYSRLPLEDVHIEYLVEEDVPSVHACVRLEGARRIRVHFLHPAPPSPTENTLSAERDAELVAMAKTLADSCDPIIVTGDLNDVAWSRTTRLFRKISKLLDPRLGRGMFNTFHAKWPFIRWPLDHLFHSEHFSLVEMRRLPAFGSDHFALYSCLALRPEQSEQHSAPELDNEDREFAKETLESQPVSPSDVPKL